MATSREDFDDTTAVVRRRFLLAVASCRPPIRSRDLVVNGLDRRTIQKRLERLRRAAGKAAVDDEQVILFARQELDRLAPPETRGQGLLEQLGSPAAREFARQAMLQTSVIGDWVELAHSPGERGWSRQQVLVREMSRSSILARGRQQSWLSEKKAFLRHLHEEAQVHPDLRRDLIPNRLKMDLVRLAATGTEDSPACSIEIGPVDWQTSLALNSRLDSPSLTGSDTVRARWGQPPAIIERRALPGMIVAHVVVETADRRFLLGLRQASGLRDETGTWSLTLEERWSAGPDGDRNPHDVVKRAVHEELGIAVADEAIVVLAWGLEVSVLYPGFIALARIPLTSWQVQQLRTHAGDANEIRLIESIPAGVDSLELLLQDGFAPANRPDMWRPWHRTSKARLFTALAHSTAIEGLDGRVEMLRALGSKASLSAEPELK